MRYFYENTIHYNFREVQALENRVLYSNINLQYSHILDQQLENDEETFFDRLAVTSRRIMGSIFGF